ASQPRPLAPASTWKTGYVTTMRPLPATDCTGPTEGGIDMPLPGTHTARQIPPSQCERIRSQPDAFGPGIGVLWCVKSGKAEIGSVHFDSAKFTVEQAKAWLKRHDLSTKDFEPATPSKQNAAAALEMEAARPELLCGGRGIFLLEA